jgi:hypothetical protein
MMINKYDVWLYCITVEAEDETEAIEKVNGVLDRALQSCHCDLDKKILESIQVDYAEEIK